jgi:phosphomannomutase / phosphoglucomutase
MSIYKPCDIRGNAATELSPSLYEGWGRALGRQLTPKTKFVVGGDVRDSTPAFLEALVEGLCQAGLDVVDLGILPTPMIYHAKRRLQAEGCAIVTASHNPASINGLKWMLHDRPPTPENVAELEQVSPLPLGEGQGEGRTNSLSSLSSGQGRGAGQSEPRTIDVSFDYVAWLQETFVDSLSAKRRAVLDPMFGGWSGKARRYLQAIFPQCIFSTLHDEADGRFNGRTPDCSRPGELEELCETVYRERADLGLAFDGDGDRVALVDNEGIALSAEETAWLLLHSLGEKLRGERFVYDLKFSDRIAETAGQLGAEPLVERSGHAFLRWRMCDCDALFGAEVSGHYFHRALGGGDDGLYTACLLIAHLAQSEQSLSELRRACPPIYVTPDLRIPVAIDRQREILDRVRAAWSDFPQQTIDGVRIDVPGGWALVRASVTESALTFRFEGLDWHALEHLAERFCDALPEELGDQLWASCRAAIGGD